MQAKLLFCTAFITVYFCLCLMPIGNQAYPFSRSGFGRCSTACNIYCPCGNLFDAHNCPICRCRPSNACTGRHPNGRPSFMKSNILY